MNNKFKSKLTRKMFLKFIGTVLLFSMILAIIFFVLYYLGTSRTWLGTEPLYKFLLFISRNPIQTYFIVWSLGMILIFLFYWYKTLKFIDELVIASSKLIDKEFSWINLSSDLSEVENQMNQIKKEAIQNSELAKLNEQKKNDLIVYLTHDIKTPLTSVIGYLSLLSEEDLSKKQREKYINIALDKSYRLEGLINELFDITRFNSESLAADLEEMNLNFLLEQISDEFYPLLMETKKEIVFDSKENIIFNGDSDKLGRAFNNIVKNAIAYSNPESTININLYKDNNNINIEIINTGKKIPEQKLTRIFDKFYRADSSRTSATGGSGLGLAIAKDIINMHHGEIIVESNNDFTKFTVILPIEIIK